MLHFRKLTLLLVAYTIGLSFGYAQDGGAIAGRVTDARSNQPLAAANLLFPGLDRGVETRADGRFLLGGLPAGAHRLLVTYVGYRDLDRKVTITAGDTLRLNLQLESTITQLGGINITALRPSQLVDERLRESEVRRVNPRDPGELMRRLGGVNAARRGPLGLDPVIRGLRETEIGAYIDNTRSFPAGPGRMDSPLSHIDPAAIESIEVVKGPYALTWGAGNMSAIRVNTRDLSTVQTPFGGILSGGYDSNVDAYETSALLQGKVGKIGYQLQGARRKGNDYTSGDGAPLPADFLSQEVRGKLGYATGANSWLEVGIGYQDQQDIDYAGRLLDADFFHTFNASARWRWRPAGDLLQKVEADFYINNVDHRMDNDDKPTAQSNPNRMPPFGLDVNVDTRAYTSGGRIALELDPSREWRWKLGADLYRVNRNAVRNIRRRDNQMLLFNDLMWPDATITDAGMYGQLRHLASEKLSFTATARLDVVDARADTISAFFEENVGADLDASETNLSGSLTANYALSEHWDLGLGAGSVVRTADATERYSDRNPSTKAQTSAEFVGNPELDPERSTQTDIWVEGNYPAWRVSLNGFYRHVDNFITFAPTNLPTRLPMSPETVFQYINGSANFWGVEFDSDYRLLQGWNFLAGIRYLWGEDKALEEPALGITPFQAEGGLRYEAPTGRWFMESNLRYTAEQERVAAARGETPTGDYLLVDLQAGVILLERVSLHGGIQNLTDREYTNHLNAKNPFTGQQIAEPGRVFFVDVQLRF